jgi:hypothetical protein
VRIWKCGLAFSAKIKAGRRWAAAEAPSLGQPKLKTIKTRGESEMGDKGNKDKGRHEEKKKAKHSLKEKRQIKKEKKNPQAVTTN